MNNVRELVTHPSVGESPTEELTRRILEARLRQQTAMTWILGGVGLGVVVAVAGVALLIWRLALNIQTGV